MMLQRGQTSYIKNKVKESILLQANGALNWTNLSNNGRKI